MRGPDTTRPQPADDWHDATVGVVIPAHNEQENIVRCLQSVLRQTLRPRHIVLVDDGSSDATAARAQAFCYFHGAEIVIVRRATSIGKTPAIKQQARALDSDVLFVLDADTVLESDNYLERTVEDLYQAVGIASGCGTVLPLRVRDRRAADESFAVHEFAEAFPSHRSAASNSWLRTVAAGITNLYREVLYLFLQRFVHPGQMAAFGTPCNPVGGAVAYRRTYLEALLDAVEPRLGDDLTNSEDIFIGMAMLNEGYRNIQVRDVSCRTVEPEVQRLPFNIGTGAEVSIRELAERIITLTSSTSSIQFASYNDVFGSSSEDMRRRVPDITKIREMVGFQPKVHLDEILERVIEYWETSSIAAAPARPALMDVGQTVGATL